MCRQRSLWILRPRQINCCSPITVVHDGEQRNLCADLALYPGRANFLPQKSRLSPASGRGAEDGPSMRLVLSSPAGLQPSHRHHHRVRPGPIFLTCSTRPDQLAQNSRTIIVVASCLCLPCRLPVSASICPPCPSARCANRHQCDAQRIGRTPAIRLPRPMVRLLSRHRFGPHRIGTPWIEHGA